MTKSEKTKTLYKDSKEAKTTDGGNCMQHAGSVTTRGSGSCQYGTASELFISPWYALCCLDNSGVEFSCRKE